MKKQMWMIFIAVAMLMISVVHSAEKSDTPFIDTLIMIESGGNWDAIGDDGKALGGLQIREEVIKDVNKFYNKKYEHNDAFKRDVAIEICWLYLKHWGKHYEDITNKKPTIETYCRIWNSGPYGYKKECSLKYWKKFMKVYKSKARTRQIASSEH